MEVKIFRKGKGYLKKDFSNKTKFVKNASVSSTFEYPLAISIINGIKGKHRKEYMIESLDGKQISEIEDVSPLEDAVGEAHGFIDLFIGMNNQHKEIKDKILSMLSICEAEMQDLLHLIEDFENQKISVIKRNKILKEIELIRKKRRKLKDVIELLKFYEQKNFKGLQTRRISQSKKRLYSPKTDVYRRLGLKLEEK